MVILVVVEAEMRMNSIEITVACNSRPAASQTWLPVRLSREQQRLR
jgi:hypothetical protein